jgi:hypothetical protein
MVGAGSQGSGGSKIFGFTLGLLNFSTRVTPKFVGPLFFVLTVLSNRHKK